METVFSKQIRADLNQARIEAAKRKVRLKVRAAERDYPIVRMWKSGFALEEQAPPIRGLVDIYDGERHLIQCLVVTTEEDAGERRFEFKRATAVADRAALDFEVPEAAPVALIERDEE